jgi:hypothetical protein
MASWHSLFLATDDKDTTIQHIKDYLQEQDYTLYDAFGKMPGRTYPQTLKCFIAPTKNGWTRVLLEYSHDMGDLDRVLSYGPLCISALLEGDKGTIIVYQRGVRFALADRIALEPYLKPHITPVDYKAMIEGGYRNEPDFADHERYVSGVKLDDLPDDLRDMARGIGGKQADNLFAKLARRLLGGEAQDAAESVLTSAGPQPQWNSDDGKLIRAVLNNLTVPDEWHHPDFSAVRQAYLLRLRLQNNPNAPSFPGDEAMMQAVPDALSYTPIYGGKGR